jgi:Spy/CpxP family protein refolding chaperone
MKRFAFLAAFAAMAAIGLAQQSAPASKPGARSGKAPLSGQLDRMVKILHLTTDQAQQVSQIDQANRQAVDQFDAANAAHLKELRVMAEAARNDKDALAQKKATADLKALAQQRMSLIDKGEQQILGVLDNQQMAQWRQVLLLDTATRRFEKLGLAEAQKAAIKKTFEALAAESDLSVEANRLGVAKALEDDILKNVLTPEQRKQFEDSAASRPKKPGTSASAPVT